MRRRFPRGSPGIIEIGKFGMKDSVLLAIFICLWVFAGCSARQPSVKATDEMTDFAQKYAKAWSGKEPHAVAEFFSDSGSLKVNNGKPAVGRVAIAKVALGFMTAFPDMVVTMDKAVEKGGMTEFHWTLAGTNTGPGGKGKSVRINGFEEWRIGADGLIAESKGHFDEAEYNRQIEQGVNK